MSEEKKLMPYEDLYAGIKEAQTLVQSQIDERIKQGKAVDPRFHGINRALNAIVINPMYAKLENEADRNSGIGKVVTPGAAVAANKAEEQKKTKIGQVVKAAEQPDPNAALQEKVEQANQEDAEFIEGLKGKTVEQLKSTAFSKEAQVQIVKKINELAKEEVIVVEETDTKGVLAEKIFNYLHKDDEAAE